MATQQQKSWKILLIGDSCLDIYHFGKCERLSPEAPVPVFREIALEERPGMSLNVKDNLSSFGIEVVHLSNEQKIKKHRYIDIDHNQHLLRVDVGESTSQPALTSLKPSNLVDVDCIVISDYDKGCVSPKFVSDLLDINKDNIPIFVDSKKKDLTIFKKCIIKINKKEYENCILDDEDDVIITLGPLGAKWQDKFFPTSKVETFDVCGAGDVFLSSLVYGYLTTRDMEKSISLANRFAAHSVTKLGTYCLTKEDIDSIIIA